MPWGASTIADAVRCGAEVFAALGKDAARSRSADAGRRRGRLRAAARFDRRRADAVGRCDRTCRLHARRRRRRSRSIQRRASSTATGKLLPAPARSPDERGRDGRALRRAVQHLSDRLDRGRPRRRRLERLGSCSTQRLGERIQTRRRRSPRDQRRAARAAGSRSTSANAILVKLNQIGTLTETLDCVADGPPGRLALRDLAPVGRDRGHDDRRPGGGDRRRPDQDRLAGTQRPDRRSTTG